MIVDPRIKGSESENYSCGENSERKLIVLTLEAGVWRSTGMSCVPAGSDFFLCKVSLFQALTLQDLESHLEAIVSVCA